ncbi:hypothetical protein PSTT_13157 [Puccinia striiformis]|uniref:Uncharacterized protein n=1 Tax=Puccinia striiformis TaxID=27350 RepID=A0A2S4UT14_9BASI|nr:hypothetical protein PSTT_13157 [Puccinia striiformis]
MKLNFIQVYAMFFLCRSAFLILANLLPPESTVLHKRHLGQIPDLNFLPAHQKPADEPPCLLESPASEALSGPALASKDSQGSSKSPAAMLKPIPLGESKAGSQKRKKDLTPLSGAKESGREMKRQKKIYPAKRKHDPNKSVSGPSTKASSEPESIRKLDRNKIAKEKDAIGPHNPERGGTVDADTEAIELFSIDDWDFVREDPERKTPDSDRIVPKEFEPERVFKLLKSWIGTGQKPGDPFFIPKKRIRYFFARYRAARYDLTFPKEVHDSRRNNALFSTVQSISNKKIQFNKFEAYSEGIIKEIRSNLERMSQVSSSRDSISIKAGIERIIEIVEDVTQVTSFLIIIYLTLFQERKPGILTTASIDNILMNLAELWTSVVQFSPESIQEHEWSTEMLWMFQTGKAYHCMEKRRHSSIAGLKYKIAWSLVACWAKRSVEITLGEDHSARAVIKKRYFNDQVHQLINKIIYSLNYENIHDRIKSNSHSGTKKGTK